MKNIFLNFCLVCGMLIMILNQSMAQNITFKVNMNETNIPLEDIVIEHIESNVSKKTNIDGEVLFTNLNLGSLVFSISGLGYKTQNINVGIDQIGKSIEIFLAKSAIDLKEVTIVSNLNRKKEFINKLDISLRPLNNSQEVLRMVPGLFIGQHAGGGKAEQIFLRGFDIDHGTDIQINVDGMPVNMVSHAHGQGYADLHFVIPELIEKVDFSKGPYLAEKGNFTTAGWVDFKTTNHLQTNILKAEIGQFDTYRTFGAINILPSSNASKGQSAYIAGEYNYSNSFFDAPQNFKRINVLAKYNDRISNNTTLNLSASYFASNWNHSGQIPERAVADGSIGFFGSIDPTEGGKTSRTNFNALSNTSLSNGGILKNQLYYSQYDFDLYSNFTFFLDDPIFGDQIKQSEKRSIIGYNSSYIKDHMIGKSNAEFTLGLQIRHDIVKDVELSKTTNRTEVRERIQFGDVKESNLSIFANEFLNLSRHLSLETGLRFDYFHNQYTNKLIDDSKESASAYIFLPKLNFYYNTSKNLQLYLKSGKGFHSNDTRVVVPQGGRQILPAAYGSDLGLIWKPIPKLIIQPAIWYLWLDQEFVYVGDAGVVEPSGVSRRIGADFTIRYQINNNFFADLDLNITRPRAIEEPKGEQFIPLAPVLTSVFGLNYVNSNGFSANIRSRYLSNRPASEDYSFVAKGYFVTDLNFSHTIDKFTFGILINNLFNTKWKETQFLTESRLKTESESVEEIHFTPGSPFFGRISIAYNF
jgi:hypothetical protein